MHDIRTIRETPDAFDAAMARRGLSDVSTQVLTLDNARRAAIHAAQTAKADQNAASKLVGAAKATGDEAGFERLRALVAAKKAEVAAMETEAKTLDQRLTDLLLTLPNVMDDDVPPGRDDSDNREIHRWGTPRAFDFQPVEHYQLPAARGLDFETAGKLSGSRFVVLRGAMARLLAAIQPQAVTR